jgi:hypothetical protein
MSEVIDELSKHGVNDETYGHDAARLVPGVATPTFVPICEAATVSSVSAKTPVIKDTVLTDTNRRDLTGLERGANSDIRSKGNFAGIVLAVIGADYSNAAISPVRGLLSRIAQPALCWVCADAGPTPAAAPNLPHWDIRVANLSTIGSPRANCLGHIRISIPCDLGEIAGHALVSLCLPGRCSAYGWRFRITADARAGFMPAYAQHLYTDGNTSLLVVTEAIDVLWRFGGTSLNPRAFAALGRLYRVHLGNSMMDAAFKTIANTGHVYLAPVANARSLGSGLTTPEATIVRRGYNLDQPPAVAQVTHGVRVKVGSFCRPPVSTIERRTQQDRR